MNSIETNEETRLCEIIGQAIDSRDEVLYNRSQAVSVLGTAMIRAKNADEWRYFVVKSLKCLLAESELDDLRKIVESSGVVWNEGCPL